MTYIKVCKYCFSVYYLTRTLKKGIKGERRGKQVTRFIRWIITILFCTPFVSLIMLWTLIQYFSWRDSAVFLLFLFGSIMLWHLLEKILQKNLPQAIQWTTITGITIIAFLMERGGRIVKTYFPHTENFEIYGWAIMAAISIGIGKFFAEKISGKIIKKIEENKKFPKFFKKI